MTALETFQALKTADYANIQAFIAAPEGTDSIPNLIARITAVENWILAKELE